LNGPSLIDPSVIELLVAHPEWSDSYPTLARSFVECGEDAAALALLDRWTPPRNAELYGWHRAARNARGMVEAIRQPYRPVPMPVLELMFHQDDDHIYKAVAFVREADLRRQDLALFTGESRKALGLLPTDSQLVELCLELSHAQHKGLAAEIFRRYLAADHGGNSKVAKYLGSMAADRAELSAYFPRGLGVISTDDLVMFASSRANGIFDDAAISALLYGDRWAAGYHHGNNGSTHLGTLLQRLDETGGRRDVLKVVDRYIDVIDDWIVTDPLSSRNSWAPLLVRIGRTAPLSEAAQKIWTASKPLYEEQVATKPNAVNSAPIRTAAALFALSGDTAKAKEALELMRLAPASAPSTILADLVTERLTLLGQYEDAFEAWIPEGRHHMRELVRAGLKAIRHSSDIEDKRRIARRVIAEMHSLGVFQDWTELDETLLSLGLKSELRSVLDAVCSNPDLNEREYEDAFRCYIALGDDEAAKRLAFPHEIKATWLLELLDEWDDSVHGSKSQLRDVAGRDVFEEGLKGFSEIVTKHPHFVVDFASLLEFLQFNEPLTDRAIVELRVCLSLLSDDLAQQASLYLLQRMLMPLSRPLPMLGTQSDVVAAVRDRLRASGSRVTGQ